MLVNTRTALFLVVLVALFTPRQLQATPTVSEEDGDLVVTASSYRVTFGRFSCGVQFAIRDAKGIWRNVDRRDGPADFALADGDRIQISHESPARLRHSVMDDHVAVGIVTPFSGVPAQIARINFFCTDEGVLVHFKLDGKAAAGGGACWPMPRVMLDQSFFDSYAFWRHDGTMRSGRFADLPDGTAYAGVSPWGNQGDTDGQLGRRCPAVIARDEATGLGFGVVLVDYPDGWPRSFTFLQRHSPTHLYFYTAIVGRKAAARGLWAWLAPFPANDLAACETKVVGLRELAQQLSPQLQSISPEPDGNWTKPLPDFPRELRRAEPIEDIREAVVFTINESIHTDYDMSLARKVGSDVLIRGWFKWRNARDCAGSVRFVSQAHEIGSLFGGGITCSALYHGENGLTENQVHDMATRGPGGQLVDAWDEPNCRHGSLSNPAYLEYLLSWCRKQIDAGVDYLFMDEINAALQGNEGFDDYSIADFRSFLIRQKVDGQGWKRDDQRWRKVFGVDIQDRDVCPDGTIGSFDYRAYLASHNLTAKPHSPANRLSNEWHAFRRQRDDRAWKWLTDAIRTYSREKERRVLISANGLARYVDLQVLGVWGLWRTAAGAIDLRESQLHDWHSTITAGWSLAEQRVPVVFFHDWGFGGYPWLKVSPDDRRLWMRIRGAEIYAAGGFFAFPVHGPFGNDSRRDGTIAEIARQTGFYQRNKDLYLKSRVLGFEPIETSVPLLSTALWQRDDPPSLILHVINRHTENGTLRPAKNVTIRIPVTETPESAKTVSPDWPGGQSATTAISDGRLSVTIPELDAYTVAVLDYDRVPFVPMICARIVPMSRWARPTQNEFIVLEGGAVRDQWELNGMLQGNLHTHLRNPPTFVVNMPSGGTFRAHVLAVATLGAKLQWAVDGRVARTIDLPDLDGKNDSSAREYDKTYEFPIPPGRHRLTLQNIGGDWARIGWYALVGRTEDAG